MRKTAKDKSSRRSDVRVYGSAGGGQAGIAVCCDSNLLTAYRNTLGFIGVEQRFCKPPRKPDSGTEYDYTDEGISYFYVILPLLAAFPLKIMRRRTAYIRDYLIDSYHEGGLKKTLSMFKCDSEQIALTAMKKTEDGKGFVLRLNELAQKKCEANISFLNAQAALSFNPNEIKTVLFIGGEFIVSDFLES